MKETTGKFLQKAERATQTANALRAIPDIEAAITRAYYAMFYVAEALLHEKGMSFSKHGGVHSAFGQHFAKSGLLDAKYHQWLLAAFEKRIIADYGVDAVLTTEEADQLIDQAVEFLAEARRYLKTT